MREDDKERRRMEEGRWSRGKEDEEGGGKRKIVNIVFHTYQVCIAIH